MDHAYDICIIGGCGHVGLPLGLLFADKGFRVLAYDVNVASIANIENGTMPFKEEGCEELLPKVLGKNFFLSNDRTLISQAKYIIVTIGTPVDEHINPQFSPIIQFMEDTEPYLNSEQCLILRSTLFPGTSEKIKNFLEAKNKKISVCFCPERIAEGYALKELQSLPQIISSFDARGLALSKELFSRICEECIVLQPLEAELAKLFTNVWRYIKFSIANQFYMIAADSGLDFSKIKQAMKHHYPRCDDFPGPGFTAGPCLFKDTMQLAAFYQHNFFLGHAAMLVNEGLPDFMTKQLKLKYGNLAKKTIGILGVTFKGESDDVRNSLAFKLRKLLVFEGAKVLCADEYWQDPMLMAKEDVLAKADIIVIGAPHLAYQNLNYGKKPVVDIWESTSANIESISEQVNHEVSTDWFSRVYRQLFS